MNNTSQITPLKVGNVNFLVTSAIERCPHNMMPRELIMNAIEAAMRDPSGKGKILIKAKEISQFPGAKKLTYWNSGPGMSDTDLSHICDIAASLKTMGLEENFGMGAKVSALGVNHLGMRYRSCKDGVVSQVVIGFENGIYGKLRQLIQGQDGTEHYEDVIDVTEKVKKEGEYSLSHDWTEVVLLGNTPDQDTVFDPYGDGRSAKQWLHDSLYHRFYRIPENVSIKFNEDVQIGDCDRYFKTIPQRLHLYGKHETVLTDKKIKITYIHDPMRPDGSHNISRNGAMSSTPAHIAIVFRGEMYDVRKSGDWSALGPQFGVAFGTRHILVHIELPDDYNVVPESYRRFLQLSDGDQHQIVVTEFAALVRDNRPEWLIDLIKAFCPKPSVDASQIEKELQNLLNSLSVKALAPRVSNDGGKRVVEGSGRGEGPWTNETNNPNPNAGMGSQPRRYMESTEGVRRATCASMREIAPKIILLTEDAQIEERGIIDRAARFQHVTNELYINTKYKSLEEITAYLERQFAHGFSEHGEKIHETAKKIAINIATVRSGRAVVHAKAKSILNTWDDSAVESACTPECLTVVVDDWADVAEHACTEMRKLLGLSARQAKIARQAA